MLWGLEITRACEERLAALRAEGRVLAPVHRSLGQEAGPVGCAHALRGAGDGSGDVLAPSVRGAGALFAHGLTPVEYFRHFFGTANSPNGGRDADLEFSDLDRGWLGSIAPLGTMVSVMAGVALSFKLKGESRVAMAFCGDGATSTGAWHEGLAIAAAGGCPLVLVIEANRWAISTPTRSQTRLHTFAAKARGYGIVGESVDGNDVVAVREAAGRAVDSARNGEGPRLLELRTYRRSGHTEDDSLDYVPDHELEEWARRDPLIRYRRALVDGGLGTREEVEAIGLAAAEAAAEGARLAGADPLPEGTEALTGVLSNEASAAPWPRSERAPSGLEAKDS
jgi:TPP-dependent pyruvate/acetoin dehydrogenase alpha subunit